MAKMKKAFDCVEMKREAEQKLRAEYESRRPEFQSYVHFLQCKAGESELARTVRAKAAKDSADPRRG